MRFISFDTETFLIRPGLAAPQLVCLSAVFGESDSPDTDPILFSRKDARSWFEEVLSRGTQILIGHNVFYDLGVICAEDPATFVPLVFKAFQDGRIRDTIIRQQLLDIANGDLKYRYDEKFQEYVKQGYSLDDLCLRLLGRVLPKEGTWRLAYGTLADKPVREWPEAAREYALSDAKTTWDVFWKQAESANDDPFAQAVGGEIPCEERATREAWALWLMSAWGIRTDGAAVAKLKTALEKEQVEAIAKLAPTGIYKKNKDGSFSKDMKEIYRRVQEGFEAQGRVTPVTATGKPQSDHETLEECGDKDLQVLADAGKGAKILNTFVPVLEQGATVAINARFNALVETYRVSCSRPNLQNPPRKGGVRECFVARKGTVFCSVDYDTIELRALAQTCLDLVGSSEMAIALRNGDDLHLNLGAAFLGISVEEAVERQKAGDIEVAEARQLAKVANFGFPGGLSSNTFVEYAKGFGVEVESGLAKRLHENWKRAWPEMSRYFDLVKNIVGRQNEGKVTSARTGFVRGRVKFTQAANHFFQHLTATGAKDALWNVTRECYDVPSSPLYGSRPVIFLHDEILVEMPEARAAEAAARQAQIMIETMAKWITDIPIKASPVLFRRWFKGAKPVYVGGKLVPSKPRELAGKVTWEADL